MGHIYNINTPDFFFTIVNSTACHKIRVLR